MAQNQTLLIIFCDSTVEPEVKQLLRAQKTGYSYFSPVLGEGRTGQKENNPIFPGANTAFFCLLAPEKVEEMKKELEAIKSTYRLTPGLSVFALSAERII